MLLFICLLLAKAETSQTAVLLVVSLTSITLFLYLKRSRSYFQKLWKALICASGNLNLIYCYSMSFILPN